MKKIILIMSTLFLSMTLMAQNQFRDYVEYRRAEWEKNKPQVEHKDGKVIITMSEAQFERMEHMRMQPHFGPMGYRPMFGPQHFNRPPMICEKCKRRMEKEGKRK